MATFGVEMFPTDYSIRPDDLAAASEERGFTSVFFPEHTHIPANRRTPFPMGGELPKEYSHIHDLLIAMTAAAMATKRIKVGAGVESGTTGAVPSSTNGLETGSEHGFPSSISRRCSALRWFG